MSGLLQYFPENRAILVQKLGAEKKWSKPVSGYFMAKKTHKKILQPLSQRGGGGLNDPTIKRRTFFAASLNKAEMVDIHTYTVRFIIPYHYFSTVHSLYVSIENFQT